MRKIKFMFISFIFLLVSGCTVDYNLNINEDLSVTESVNATEYTKRMQAKTNLKGEQAVDYLFDMFKRENEDIDLSFTDDNGETVAKATTTHNSLNEYSNKFTSDVFDEIDVTTDGNTTTIYATQSNMLGGDGMRTLVYDNINVNIKIPFTVIENNADSVSNNIYTWKINKSKKMKTIKISFDTKQQKNSANINIGKNTLSFKYEYIAIGLFIAIILFIVVFVSIKNKKNNRI